MEDGNRVAFHLFHAIDYPEAPKLMDRAFSKFVREAPGFPDARQRRVPFPGP